jgi:hypothetical protein
VYFIAVFAVAAISASLAAGLIYSFALAFKYSSGAVQGSVIALAGTVLFATYVAILALLPAILGIIYAERTGARSIFFYAAGGVFVGIVSYGLYAIVLILSAGTAKGFFGGSNAAQVTISLILLFGAPGFVGGLMYWLIAGRNAGR